LRTPAGLCDFCFEKIGKLRQHCVDKTCQPCLFNVSAINEKASGQLPIIKAFQNLWAGNCRKYNAIFREFFDIAEKMLLR
jgi:hypothetical protein